MSTAMHRKPTTPHRRMKQETRSMQQPKLTSCTLRATSASACSCACTCDQMAETQHNTNVKESPDESYRHQAPLYQHSCRNPSCFTQPIRSPTPHPLTVTGSRHTRGPARLEPTTMDDQPSHKLKRETQQQQQQRHNEVSQHMIQREESVVGEVQ